MISARERISLDGAWHFAPDDAQAGMAGRWFEDGSVFAQSIRVPGCWQAQGHYCQTAWYRTTVTIPEDWRGKCVWLKFGGVSYESDVWINGQHTIHNEGHMLPFEANVSAYAHFGTANTVVVRVAQYDYANVYQTEQLGDKIVGVYGCWITWGGIFQPVTLEATTPTRIDNVFMIPDIDHERVTARVRLRNASDAAQPVDVAIRVTPGDFAASASTTVPVGESVTLDVPVDLRKVTLWHPDQPFLYTADVSISGGGVLDSVATRFGMRLIEVRGKGIYLNHEPIFLRGWLDDAIYPEQISPTITVEEARTILRACKQYGFNFVRHHTHVPVTAFHEAADELGVLQLQEFGSFGSIGNPRMDASQKTRRQIEATWRGMIERDHNHPSLIGYGVNNECWNEHEFLAWAPVYRDLYRVGKELDPTRLVIDNSGGEDHWSVASDVYDKHIYQFPTEQEMLRTSEGRPYRGLIASREGYFNADLAQVNKPCLVTEVGGWCTFPNFEAMRARTGSKETPWWFSRSVIRNPRMAHALYNRMEAEMPRDLYPRIIANSERYAAMANKLQLEHLRATPGISGYAYCTFTDCYNWSAGILDNYFQPKAYAGMFAHLNAPSVLLWRRSRWCFRSGEALQIELSLSHFGAQTISAGRISWSLLDDEKALASGALDGLSFERGGVHDLAPFTLTLPDLAAPARLTFRVELADAQHTLDNEWSLWVFPAAELDTGGQTISFEGADFEGWNAVFPSLKRAGDRANVIVTPALSEAHVAFLEAGGRVLWLQSGGELNCRPYNQQPAVDYHATIVDEHPVTAAFPNEGWCDLQFHHLTGSAVLDTGYFADFRPIIEAFHVPYWTQNPRILPFRRKGFLAEAQVGAGRLLTTTFVFDKIGGYPEVEAMARALLAYLLAPTASAQRLSADDLREWAWGSVHGAVETDFVPFLM